MAKSKSIPKLSLSVSRDIPLNKLVLSQANVRQVKAGVSIDELAEDIARRTLLQSLTVRAVLDEAGNETGQYEVPAGGRRFRALELLVKQKRLAPNAPVPCVIRTEGLAEEDSLAENIQRAPLHPLDQFRAFKTLREKGKSEEEIAAAFFVSVTVVRQRLKLAAVAPALLDLYAEEQISLDQLMAFTLSGDHQRQVEVWEAMKKGYARDPYHIRRLLTEGAVRAGDKRARFVGVDAYEAAGGAVLRDLFADADDGWLQDAALLNRMVAEKLEASAAEVRGEGWKWLEVAVDFPYGHTFGLRRISGERSTLTEEEQQSYDTLKAEYHSLQEQYESAQELPEEVDKRFGELEAAIEAIESRPFQFPAEEVARAAAFVSIDPSGQLRIERGYVRPEDEPKVEADDQVLEGSERDSFGADAGSATSSEVESPPDRAVSDEEAERPIPDRVVADLTTYRTIALRDALSRSPEIARLAALQAMALTIFYHQRVDSCMMLDIREGAAGASRVDGLADFSPAAAYAERHDAFASTLPQESSQLWAMLCAMPENQRDALFAHCASFAIDAVIEPYNRRPRSIAHADDLALALNLDMREAGWRPTAANYFGRVTKAHILEAVRETKGEEASERIAGMKKPEMAAAAEELLKDSAWIPAALRTPGLADDGPADEGVDLPASSSKLPAIPAIAAE
ncbi:MAG: ParB N-terminal domain-containing protein [Parvularculaceae bacterium]